MAEDTTGKASFGFSEESMKAFFRQNEDVRKALGMLPWVPAMFTFLFALLAALMAQLIYCGATGWDKPVTFGLLLTMIVISLWFAVIVGSVVRLVAGKKMMSKMRAKGII